MLSFFRLSLALYLTVCCGIPERQVDTLGSPAAAAAEYWSGTESTEQHALVCGSLRLPLSPAAHRDRPDCPTTVELLRFALAADAEAAQGQPTASDAGGPLTLARQGIAGEQPAQGVCRGKRFGGTAGEPRGDARVQPMFSFGSLSKALSARYGSPTLVAQHVRLQV